GCPTSAISRCEGRKALLLCTPASLTRPRQMAAPGRDWRPKPMAKILIVDDSPTQMANMTKIVESHGHTTITASNGLEGVAKAKSEKPDLILMDVVMPELNGFQATRKITKDP